MGCSRTCSTNIGVNIMETKELQNKGYIDDMLESHKYIDEGGVLLNDNCHEVRDLHHEIIIVPDNLRQDYEVSYNEV